VGHRRYQPGDDLRYLDWHLLARIGRPYVRQFLSQRSERLDILVDKSRSMSLGRPPKTDVACALAFVFGYLASSAGGRVGATCFAQDVLARLPAGRGPAHQARLLRFLADVPVQGMTSIARSLRAFAGRATEVGRLVVISDLLDDETYAGLTSVRDRGFDVTVLRVRAACDEEPDLPDGAVCVMDAETGARQFVTLGAEHAIRYRRERRIERESSARFCDRAGIAFATVGTWQSLPDLVFRELRQAGFWD
jgi:uncharacterized protein (DUF58 family)